MLSQLERRRKRDSWNGVSSKSSSPFRNSQRSSPMSAKKRRRRSLSNRISVAMYGHHKNGKSAEDTDKVLVSWDTVNAMKQVADELYPSSLQTLATAWQESNTVLDSHTLSTNSADTTANHHSSSNTTTAKSCSNSNAIKALLGRTSKPSQKLPISSIRRQLKNVFQGLATQVGSLDRQVSNWEDAHDILTNVLTLPKKGDPTHAKQNIQSSSRIRRRLAQTNEEQKASLHSYLKTITLAARKRGFLSDIEKWANITSYMPTKKESTVEEKPSAVQRIDALLQDRITEQTRKHLQSMEKKKRQQQIAATIAKREAQKLLQSLLRPFTAQEDQLVHKSMYAIGPPDEILVQDEESGDQVIRSSLQTLQPGQWLNDEVIHYFYKVLANRDAEHQQNNTNTKRCHFFKSFFITKLLDEGATDTYRYNNVKRWSKKVPGKDIFNLNKIFIPININGVHWCCAVIYIQRKRIEFLDPMGGSGMAYLQALKRYLMDEWQSKKGGGPLPDADQWELITGNNRDDVPKQQNSFDCGVFTCMFADFISRDIPLLFSQTHMDDCRKRIALSIIKGVAIQ